jgi:predicted NBD/HSP70 family sugar kinase
MGAVRNNKKKVLECIQNQGPINRAAIAKDVGISLPAVMSITNELEAKKIIRSAGFVSEGVGKHPELLEIRSDYFYYIGVDVGRLHLRGTVVGQDGREITKYTTETNHGENPEQCIEDICSVIQYVVEKAAIDNGNIVGVCVAMPGLIELGSGKVIFSPNFGWKNVPLQDILNKKLSPYKVIVRNANRAQARFELRPGAEYANKKVTVFCIGLGYGIGSATIINGNMYYGASGTSGEIGHITVMPNGPICTCGNTGCLEALSSGAAIEKQGKNIARMNPDSMLCHIVDNHLEKIDAKAVFRAAALNDVECVQIIDNAAKYIGIAIAAAINILDPDIIYVCGGLTKNGSDFLEKIKKYTRARQMKFAGRHVKIIQGSQDDYNVAKGATLMIQDEGNMFEKLSFLY